MGMSVAMRKEEEEWRVESDMRTLMEAEEIRRDPKRLAKATAKAQEKLLEIAAVAGESKPPAKKA